MLRLLFGGGKNQPRDYSDVKVDLHSHLLPGIDDGAKSIADSIEMISGLYDLGYRKFVTTPHVISDSYPNTTEIILAKLDELRESVAKIFTDVEIDAAAEYYVDESFYSKIGKEEFLTFGGEKRYILFETSYVSRPIFLEKAIYNLRAEGYFPVMAHPERYQYFWIKTKDAIEEVRMIKDRGVLMQVNISSFAGRNSKNAAVIARALVNEEMVDFIGTDIHKPAQLETIRKALKASRELGSLVSEGQLKNVKL